MSTVNRGRLIAQRLQRKHRLVRDQVDALPWPHPRPAADPRIVCLNIAFIWTSSVQAILGPPPNTVQGISFGYAATLAFSALLIICSLLCLYAAFCKSQYNSFGIEMAATTGFAGVFIIYSAGAIAGVNDWWGTNTAALAIMLFVGNSFRAAKLIWRMW